jgi:uncharacterized protein YecE (DUF72 family)
VARVLVGTSGYSYTDWVGPVYPPGTRPEEYLELYARRFGFVELNFSFYRQPEAPMVEKLRARVPEGFLFSAKAHRSLTHEPAADVTEAARAFREGMAPLRETGQLAAVLLQFPYSFHYADESRLRLDRVCRALEGFPLAVEFRNRDWDRERVVSELSRRGVSRASVDLPALPGLPPPTLEPTAPLAYLRFHGRNAATWWTGDNVSRYDYRYTAAELEEWARRALGAIQGLSLMIVAFNNHYRGQAVDNAAEFRDLLARGGV